MKVGRYGGQKMSVEALPSFTFHHRITLNFTKILSLSPLCEWHCQLAPFCAIGVVALHLVGGAS